LYFYLLGHTPVPGNINTAPICTASAHDPKGMSAGAAPSLLREAPGEDDHARQVLEGQDIRLDALEPHPLAEDPQLAVWDVDSGSESDDSLGDGTRHG